MGTRMYAHSTTLSDNQLLLLIVQDYGYPEATLADIDRWQTLHDAFHHADPSLSPEARYDAETLAYEALTSDPLIAAIDHFASEGFGKLTGAMYEWCRDNHIEQYGGGCDDTEIIPTLLRYQLVDFLSPITIALIDSLGWG